MPTYFEQHPPKLHQWQAVRDPRGVAKFHEATGTIVIHTFEAPISMGTKRAADFLVNRTDRQASYHCLAGPASTTDVLQLAPWSAAAWHETHSNRWSIGISMVTAAAAWGSLTKTQRSNLVASCAYAAAQAAKWLKQARGIAVPARRISRAQAMNGQPGFISHGEMDPGRRTDPGAGFPWQQFLDTFAALMGTKDADPAPPTQEDDDMPTAKEVADAVWDHQFQATEFDGQKIPADTAGQRILGIRKLAARQDRRAAETLILTRGYEAALDALAKAQGGDAAAITKTVKASVDKALADLSITLTTGKG